MSALRKASLLAVAALASLAIAACGGDDDEETPSASDEPATEEEFVAEVTALCDEVEPQVAGTQEALTAAVLGDGDLQAVINEELLPIYEGLATDLEAIEPPPDLADTYDEYLATVNESIDLLDSDAEELFEASTGGENEITQQADELEAETDRLSAELGIPETCGEAQTSGTTGAEGAG